MWRTLALLAAVGFLLVSVVGNVALFAQAAANAAEAATYRERLQVSQEERAALEARVNELNAENQRLRVAVPTPSASAPAPPPGPGGAGPDRSILQRIEEQVSRLRGLPKRAEVPLRFLDREALRQYLVASLDRDYLPAERESDQKLLVTLGLLQPEDDLLQITLELLQEQVIGFYDEEEKVLYVVDDAGQFGPGGKTTFAHEFAHALQDQYFDLARLRPKHGGNDDRYAAVTALAEGDAMLLERQWVQENLSAEEINQLGGTGDASKLAQAPLVVRTELLFPYVSGFDFTLRAYQRANGFAGLDAAFRDPPASTEQVLHPEKYVAREAPVEVALPDLAAAMGDGWRQVGSNVLGELDVRILLEQYGDRGSAVRAANGWGGDRWQLLEKDGRQAVVLRTTWDSDGDAREFFDTYGQGLRNRFAGARQQEATPTRQALTALATASELRLSGREVLAVISFDRPSAEALAAAVGGF